MITDSMSVSVRREQSDLGTVFPCGVRIGTTPYGFGVFAFAFIPEGTPIARVMGTVIHDPNYGSDYCIDAGEGMVLEPEPPFCYLNHACEPNCQLMVYVEEEENTAEEICATDDDDCIYGSTDGDDEFVPEKGFCEEEEETGADTGSEVWVEAIRDIMPNEELTIDYAWPADRAVRCLCGQPQCRGWIVDPAERNQLPG